MNNSFSITKNDNSVVITSGKTVLQFPMNSLILIADDTDVIYLRTKGSRRNIVELLWSWVSGASTKAEAISTIAQNIFA